MSALCNEKDIHLKQMEMILTTKVAETQYVGAVDGKLDQSCEAISKKTHTVLRHERGQI